MTGEIAKDRAGFGRRSAGHGARWRRRFEGRSSRAVRVYSVELTEALCAISQLSTNVIVESETPDPPKEGEEPKRKLVDF